MKLAVVGAGCPTGEQVVWRARAAGHEVTEIVRAPVDGPPDPHDLAGVDSVVFLAGERHRSTSVTRSASVVNLLRTLRDNAVGQVLTVSPAALEIDEHDPWSRRMVMRLFVHKRNRNVYLDYERMEQELRWTDVDWTVVRVPRLHDGPATGRYRVAEGGQPPSHRPLSRGDLADFLVDRARTTGVGGRMVAVGADG